MEKIQSPNITIFSGISGIDKEKIIKNLVSRAKKEDEVFQINFDDELLNENRNPPESAPDIATFLNSDDPKLKLETIETNFTWIAKKIDERPDQTTDIFLNMHLSYFKNSEFYPPFIPLYFNQLFTKFPNSEVRIITLIDDVFSIWAKIKKREPKGFLNTQLTLKEILAWRSLESLRSEALKQHLFIIEEGTRRVSNFVVSVRHPYNTFYNLIFEPNPSRIYLSFPISETRTNPDDLKDINEFRKEMHKIGYEKGVAIFDPVAIDELAMDTALNESISNDDKTKIVTIKNDHRWPFEIPDSLADDVQWPIEIPRDQVEDAIPDVKNQIASRDYTLVDSSLFLSVYRPIFNGILSRGVDAEIKRANNHFKKVIVYHPENDQKKSTLTTSTHPFGSKVDQFDDKQKFIDYLQQVIKNQKAKDKS